MNQKGLKTFRLKSIEILLLLILSIASKWYSLFDSLYIIPIRWPYIIYELWNVEILLFEHNEL